MRTTIDVDEDVAAAVAQLRQGGVGLSEAVNRLARAGLSVRPRRSEFHQRGAPIGLRIDIANVAEALELLDEPHSGGIAGVPQRAAESQAPRDGPPNR